MPLAHPLPFVRSRASSGDKPGPSLAAPSNYYGDNLQVLRDSIATESVDLIYLDPPFNSNATYNVGLLGESGRERMRGQTAACSQERKCREILVLSGRTSPVLDASRKYPGPLGVGGS